MRLYKFMPREFAIENLLNRQIKISRILELNDPFEWAAVRLGDPKIRHLWMQTRKLSHEKFGVVSFCKSWNNPVLWAHYAESHRGICIGIDVPDQNVAPIIYSKSRVKHSDVFDQENLPHKGDKLNPNYITKFAHWKYEQEYRWFCEIDQKKSQNGLYFLKIDEILREVIIGHRCNLAPMHVDRALGDLKASVDVFRARPAFTTFNMVRQRNKTLALTPGN